mmetsp:Transcript_90081/g.263368  ORF Transcript_90081/g.263368 Transcript_90081/m.263368 type:complete len:228 (-) Transcript_90081:357-1040(-)
MPPWCRETTMLPEAAPSDATPILRWLSAGGSARQTPAGDSCALTTALPMVRTLPCGQTPSRWCQGVRPWPVRWICWLRPSEADSAADLFLTAGRQLCEACPHLGSSSPAVPDAVPSHDRPTLRTSAAHRAAAGLGGLSPPRLPQRRPSASEPPSAMKLPCEHPPVLVASLPPNGAYVLQPPCATAAATLAAKPLPPDEGLPVRPRSPPQQRCVSAAAPSPAGRHDRS